MGGDFLVNNLLGKYLIGIQSGAESYISSVTEKSYSREDLVNGKFENNLDDWDFRSGTGTQEIDDGALKLTSFGAAFRVQTQQQTLNTTINETYNLTGQVLNGDFGAYFRVSEDYDSNDEEYYLTQK